LRAGADTGAERHPNSHQRMMSFEGSGDLQTGEPERWQSNVLISDPAAPLEQRWISIPRNVWHRPVIDRDGRALTGRLSAFTAEWNNQYFNQGSPKPGSSAGQVHGRYDPRTRHYVLEWRSPIKGGPFDGFTGLWHLEGVVR